MIRRIWPLAVLLAGVLAGCQGPPPEAFVSGAGRPAAAAAAVPVGNNEVGEPCRFQLASSAIGARRDAVIYCGNWDQPSGRVSELAEPADPAQLNAVTASGSWRSDIDQRFACGAPSQTRILGGSPAVLMQCTRRVGGWPHLAMAAIVGGRIFAADAVQPALPAVEATIAALTGQASPATAGLGSEARRLIAQRGGGGSFGSGDAARFFQQLRLGDAYNNIDDPVSAERAYREALAIQQKVLGPDDPGLALTTMKLAAQLAHQQNSREAERLLARAGQLIATRPDPLLAAQLDFYQATAAAYGGKTREAIELTQRAEAAFARLAPDAASALQRASAGGGGVRGSLAAQRAGLESLLSDESAATNEERAATAGLAEAMRLRATLLQFSGRIAEAGELARQTQRLLEASGLSVSSTAARSLRLIASNQAVTGAYPAAAGTSAEAGRVFGRVTPGEPPQARNLLSEGYYLMRSNRVGAALDSFRRAGAILRSPALTVGVSASPESIVPWLDALHAASGNRAQLDAEMFEAAQFARGSQTAQDIARATAALIASDPKAAEAFHRLEELRSEVARLERERVAAADEKAPPERIAAIDQRIEAAARARDEAGAAVQGTLPTYAQVVEKPALLSEVQALLGADEAFAFFFVAESGSYGFLARSNSVVAYKIPLNAGQIRQLVQRLRDTTVAKPGGLPTPDFAASFQLYSALFGPVEQHLAGVPRLSVAATGDLLRYPLEALTTQAGARDNDGDYRQVPFLIRRVALSYVPAPRVLVNIRRARMASAARPFIGFGDFRPATAGQLAASFPPDRCGDDARILQGLLPLPDTRTQVITTAQQLGAGAGDIVLGEAFNKQRLVSPDLAQYRIVLLATHAFLPAGRLRCLTDPVIAVSPSPRAPNADGEFLRPADIASMRLNADLVALSACDTSGGQAGESLSGLARSFFLAGARGLLVSHWDVVTGASVPLMTGTFGAGGGTRDSAQALRAAQLQMIDSAGSSTQFPIEISHPNYWAAFVLIGDGVRAGPGA